MIDEVFKEIHWRDSEKWEIKYWYPLPIRYMERDQKEEYIDGWEIFQLDPEGFPGDITPITRHRFTFSQALEICEAHNNEPLVS